MSLPGWFNDWNATLASPTASLSPDTLWQSPTWAAPAPLQRSYDPFLNSNWNPLITDIPTKVFSPPPVAPASVAAPPLPPMGGIDSLTPALAKMVLQVTEPADDPDSFPEGSYVPVSGAAGWSNATASQNAAEDIEQQLTKQCLYKSELCRSFEETGKCRYGSKCQFAHGRSELRPVLRHPKYKTEVCKTFQASGSCPYGIRCRFIHINSEEAVKAAAAAAAAAQPPVNEEHAASEDARTRRRSKRRSRQKTTSEKESKPRLSFFQQLVPLQ
ncbi:MAG: zinc finger CCCH domain-containing protein [archaeon]|nr:zinc finger CCCH domain-containing protein [archaeon]